MWVTNPETQRSHSSSAIIKFDIKQVQYVFTPSEQIPVQSQ